MLDLFGDASLYQTVEYGQKLWSEKFTEYCTLHRGTSTLSIAQVRLVSLPLLGPIMAYVLAGPMWRLHGDTRGHCLENLDSMLTYLRAEYTERRRLGLRIAIREPSSVEIETMLEHHGFETVRFDSTYETFLIDLQPDLEVLRKQVDSKWRYNLRRAEKANLAVECGTTKQLFTVFSGLYAQLREDKDFPEYVDVQEYMEIHKAMEEATRFSIAIAYQESRPLAGLVWTDLGDTGISIFSAANSLGRKCRAAFLLRWSMLCRLKQKGKHYFDQGGVDKNSNLGGYKYKQGFGGRLVRFVPKHQVLPRGMRRLIINIAQIGVMIARRLIALRQR